MVDTADTKATITDGAKIAQEKETRDEAYGASQIGPFDYCPKLGFREYWYPAIWANKVGKKPVNRQLMGEEVVFFRGENENVVALTDWCPHRGARFSNGFCEFKGTITCPYHGYTFDETGQCVAGLVESDDSPLAPKMKAQKYPTAEWNGIVFIWMGITEPVPLDRRSALGIQGLHPHGATVHPSQGMGGQLDRASEPGGGQPRSVPAPRFELLATGP